MNLAYYVVLFDEAVEALFGALGYDDAYRTAYRHGPFAVETHTIYRQELLAGERIRIASTVLAADARRLHIAHEMMRADDGAQAAYQEVLYLNVDLFARRAAAFGPDLQQRIATAAAAHAMLPRPSWVGRSVGMTKP